MNLRALMKSRDGVQLEINKRMGFLIRMHSQIIRKPGSWGNCMRLMRHAKKYILEIRKLEAIKRDLIQVIDTLFITPYERIETRGSANKPAATRAGFDTHSADNSRVNTGSARDARVVSVPRTTTCCKSASCDCASGNCSHANHCVEGVFPSDSRSRATAKANEAASQRPEPVEAQIQETPEVRMLL